MSTTFTRELERLTHSGLSLANPADQYAATYAAYGVTPYWQN